MSFIEANYAAHETAKVVMDTDEKLDVWLAMLDGDPAASQQMFEKVGVDTARMRKCLDDLGHFAVEALMGVVWISRIETRPHLTRPDILLVTMHPETTRETAYMQHARMAAMLNINEEANRTIAMLETVLVQAQGALTAQRIMLADVNAVAEDMFHLQANLPTDRS